MIKKIFIFCLLIGFFQALPAQVVMSFQEIENHTIEISTLDTMYQSGIHSDTSLAVFKEDVDQYISAYQNFVQGLGRHLAENDFTWETKLRSFNRIYFNPAGEVDYYIYQFVSGEVTKEKEAKFKELVKTYIQKTTFGLTTNQPFAQCSPVTYQ